MLIPTLSLAWSVDQTQQFFSIVAFLSSSPSAELAPAADMDDFSGSTSAQRETSASLEKPPQTPEHPDGHDDIETIDNQSDSSPEDTPGRNSSDELAGLRRRNTQTMIGDDDRAELYRIATALSQTRSNVERGASVPGAFAAFDKGDPAYDPAHKDFDLSKWLQGFVKELNAEGKESKRTGIVYKNLNVFGSGSALQLQQTVGSFLLAPFRLGKLFSGSKTQKQILRNFDGVVRSGELLIVLGRPGSGCSTLLKSMCGELHGLTVDEASTIHYNGIPQAQMMKEFKGEASYNQEVR